VTSTAPGTPDDFDSTIAKLGRELVLAANSPSVPVSTVVQVGILESIANECGRQVLRLYEQGDDEPNRMGLYDDEMVVYELLSQGWGHWLYSGSKAVDERLARSVVQVTLATCSICPGFDLNNRASGAVASHCDTSRGRDLVYPILKEIVERLDGPEWGEAQRIWLEREWGSPLGISLESVGNLSEIFNWIGDGPVKPRFRNDRSLWSFDEGQWSSRRPQEHTDEQPDQSDPETPATPPLNRFGVMDDGQGAIVHAILGPVLTEDLVRAVAASGLQEGILAEFAAQLRWQQDRKYPEMLFIMAAAAHAAGVAQSVPKREEGWPPLVAGYHVANKQFGWEVLSALRRFGVDPFVNREDYDRWLQAVAKKDGWNFVPPLEFENWSDSEEDESEAGNNTEGDLPRRRARLIDRFNRRVGNGIERLRNRR